MTNVLSCSVTSDSLQPHGLWLARLLCPWGFSKQEYWCGLPCPPPGDPPNPGIEPRSPALQADSLPTELSGKPVYLFSRVQTFATLWTVARQAPLSMAFPRQEYCSGFPFPPPGDPPNPGIKPVPLVSPALPGRFFTTSTTWESLCLFLDNFSSFFC